jgi:hypothetical protein
MKQYVAKHKEWGVFLGSFLGMAFFSKVDSAGQDSAVAFREEAEAREYMTKQLKQEEADFAFVPVECGSYDYATIDECEAAGVERWSPEAEPAVVR